MRYWVGCTIKTVKTSISCDINIGHLRKENKTGFYEWSKFAGRLDLNAEKGNWIYLANNSKKIIGISICVTNDTTNPYFQNPANALVDLLDVPERFAEHIGCGDYLSGKGTLRRTGEEIAWLMWYPCV